MANLIEKIRRLISPDASERGAEDDIIARAPENVRERLRREMQRLREIKRAARGETAQDRAMRDNT